MRSIPLFGNGGWLNSTDGAFNQPSTYVGLKYVQRNPELPPLEGIQKYLEDQEKARQEHEAYQKLASPDDAKFGELLNSGQGKALSGQLNELSSQYNAFRQEFAKRFQGDAVFSDEAKQALAQMNARFSPAVFNQMNQDKVKWDDQKKRVTDRKIGGQIWTDGNQVLVRNNKTGEVSEVGADLAGAAMEDPEQRKEFSLLTNDEAIHWKDNNWKIGESDRVTLGNQMSMEELNDHINKMLTGIGHSASDQSGEQVRNLSQYFQSIGVDAGSGNVMEQISTKFKNNQAQLAEAKQRIYASLSDEAKATLVAQMLAKGQNPYGTTEIDTPNGKVEISNLAMNLEQIVGSATNSRAINESGRSSSLSAMSSVLGEGKDGEPASTSWLTEAWNDPSKIEGARKIPRWLNPDPLGPKETVALSVPIRSDHVLEKYGWTAKINTVVNGKEVVIAGRKVRVGTAGNKNDPRQFIELPGASEIVYVDETVMDVATGKPKPDPNDPSKPLVMKKGYLVRQALVPSSTLASLNGEYGKSQPFEINTTTDRGINGAEADLQDVDAKSAMIAAGVDPEFADAYPFGGTDDYYTLRYYEPVNELDGLTDDKNVNDRKIFGTVSSGMNAYDRHVQGMREQAAAQKNGLPIK